MFQTDAGRTACTRPYSAAAWPLVIGKAKAPTKGLSTLNSMAFGLAVYASPSSLPHPTQDSLPVAGQALLDGVLTRKVPMKGSGRFLARFSNDEFTVRASPTGAPSVNVRGVRMARE